MTRANDTARILAGGVVFNEAGADVDFRIESDTVANALFVDGASGNVGIATMVMYLHQMELLLLIEQVQIKTF